MKTIDLNSYLNSLSPEKVQFINLPIYYDEKKYEISIKKVVDYLSRFSEIAAIYQIGGINNPGISDIDLIVVFKDDVKSFQYPYQKILNKDDSYLFMHGIYGMPANIFKKKEILIPVHNSKNLYGESIPQEVQLTTEEKIILEKIYATEYLVINLFNLTAQFFLRRLKVRNLLCSFNALAYDFNILSGGNPNNEQKHFSERLSFLREAWWNKEHDSNNEFYMLCRDAIEILLKTLYESPLNNNMKILNNKNSYLQVGHNSYVRKDDYLNAKKSRMELKETGIAIILEKLSELIPSKIIKKQILDAKEAFYAIFLCLPDYLFRVLNGQIEGVYMDVYKKRKSLLENYYEFMGRINSQYAIFDILRFYQTQNIKWTVIRLINKLLYEKQ